MPTMLLTLTWLLTSTTHLAAFAPSSQPASFVVATTHTASVAPGSSDDGGPTDWTFIESDTDEELEDSDDFGIISPLVIWPEPRSPFGRLASNPHPTFLATSALRSPTLRC